jgi:hypothetical protein
MKSDVICIGLDFKMVFICRLCGKCENESSGLAIFGEQGVKEALAYKIKLSLDISVSDIAVSKRRLSVGHWIYFI